MIRGVTEESFRLRAETSVSPWLTDHPGVPGTFPNVSTKSPESWGTPQFWDSVLALAFTFVVTVLTPRPFSFVQQTLSCSSLGF